MVLLHGRCSHGTQFLRCRVLSLLPVGQHCVDNLCFRYLSYYMCGWFNWTVVLQLRIERVLSWLSLVGALCAGGIFPGRQPVNTLFGQSSIEKNEFCVSKRGWILIIVDTVLVTMTYAIYNLYVKCSNLACVIRLCSRPNVHHWWERMCTPMK